MSQAKPSTLMATKEPIIHNYTMSKRSEEKMYEIIKNFYLRSAADYIKYENTNIELELRLGEFINEDGRDYFSSGVSYDEFSRFYTFLQDNSRYPLDNQDNYLDIILSIQGFRIRISIKGTDDIMKYCNTNIIDFSSDNTSITIKNRITDDPRLMNFRTYQARLGVSREDNFVSLEHLVDYMNKNKKRGDRDLDEEALAKLIAETKKQYRFKQRMSYSSKDYRRFRLDLTQVKQHMIGRDIEEVTRLADSKLFTQAPVYEVEAEYILTKPQLEKEIRDSRPDDIVTDFVEFLGILLQIRQDNELVVDKYDEETVIKNFMRLYFDKNDVDREFDTLFDVKDKKYNRIFPGAKVSTLELDHLKRDSGKPYIFNDYTVTDKADGERYILFVANTGYIYLFNDRLNIIRTDVHINPRTLYDTILDGELIITQKNGIKVYNYYAFDCLFHNRNNISKLNLINKTKSDASRLKTLIEIVDTLNTSAEKTKINGVSILDIKYKTYKVITGEQIDVMKDHCTGIWTGREAKYPYHLDGLIFTPKYEAYPLGKSWASALKWKPPSENSIDFLIKFNTGEGSIYTKVIDGEAKQFRLAKLYCGDNVEKKKSDGSTYLDYVEREFDIPNTIGRDSTSVIRLPLDEEGNTFGLKDELSVRDNTIVECVYNREKGTWVVNKTRLDKTQRYQESGHKIGGTANNFNVAISIWKTIVNPITEEMITGKSDIEGEGAYYTETGSDLTKPMRSFNNYIKSLMIAGASTAGNSLLDLSCGRGGDINKWKASKYSRIVGLDFSQHGINSLDEDGATGRLLKLIVRNDEWAKKSNINFFWADTSKITTAAHPNGICEDIKKAQATEALKTPFDVITSFFTAHYYFENNMKIRGFVQNIYDNLKSGGFALITCFDGDSIFKLLSNKKYDETISGTVTGTPVWEIKKSYRKTTPLVADKTSVGVKIQIKFESISEDFIPEWLVKYDYFTKVLGEYDIKLIGDDEAKSKFNLPKATGLFSEILENLEQPENLAKLGKSESGKPFFRDIKELVENDDYISLRQWAEKQRYFILRKGPDVDNSVAKGWRSRLSKFDCKKQYSGEDEGVSIDHQEVKEAIMESIPAPVPEPTPTPVVIILPQVETPAVAPKKKIIPKPKPAIPAPIVEQPAVTQPAVAQPSVLSEQPAAKPKLIRKKPANVTPEAPSVSTPSEPSVVTPSEAPVPAAKPKLIRKKPANVTPSEPAQPSEAPKSAEASKSAEATKSAEAPKSEESSVVPPPIILKKKTKKTPEVKEITPENVPAPSGEAPPPIILKKKVKKGVSVVELLSQGQSQDQ